MLQVLLFYKIFLGHLKKYFIGDQDVENVLGEEKFLKRAYLINLDKMKVRFTSPFYAFIYIILFFGTFSFSLVLINLTYVLVISIQPQFNKYLNQLIADAREQHQFSSVLKICAIFGTFKCFTSLVSISHDLSMQFLGTRIYSLMSSSIIKYCEGNSRQNGNIITLIEEDCEHFVNLPYAIITILVRNLQFFFLIGYMVSIINQYQLEIIIIYLTYFIGSVIISYKTAVFNLRICNNKQKRLSFADYTIPEIRGWRALQIKNIKKMMVLNGISNNVADFTNSMVMILIYSMTDMDTSIKSTLLIIFGLLKATVNGIGSALSIVGEVGSSTTRIIQQLSINIQDLPIHNSQQKQQYREEEEAEQKQLTAISDKNTIKYTKILGKVTKQAPFFVPLTFFFMLLSFVTFYSYGYFAQSITHGNSATQPLNLIILISQFAVPTAFFAFLCFHNLIISQLIYDTILQKPQKLKGMTSQQLNRLNGDSRMIDRNLSVNVFNNFSGICRVLSSLLYSIVHLKNIALCFLFIFIFAAVIFGFGILFRKTMIMRRNIFRREVLSKGHLLSDLKKCVDSYQNFVKVYCFKQFGKVLETGFIFAAHVAIVLLVTVLIGTLLTVTPDLEQISVLIVMLMPLDVTFVQVCTYWIHFEITLTSTERCIVMIDQFSSPDQPSSNQIINDETLLTQSLIN